MKRNADNEITHPPPDALSKAGPPAEASAKAGPPPVDLSKAGLSAEALAKAGYKHTPLGWLPKEWVIDSVKNNFRLVNGKAFKPRDWKRSGIPIVRIQNLNDENAPFNYFDGSVEKKYHVSRGDLLFAWSGSIGVSFGARIWNGEKAYLNQHIFKVYPGNKIDEDFALFLLQMVQNRIERKAHGFKSSFVHVKKSELEKTLLPLPPLPEQQKIAAILSAWDRAIGRTQALIAAKEERRRGVMQRLLTGKVRVKGFEGAWREVKVKEIFSLIEESNDGLEHTVMTISARFGLISQKEKFDRVIAGDSLKRYTLIRAGDFAYNKGNSKLYEMGCIYRLEDIESALVPFVYICFRPSGKIDSTFYKHWFLAHGLDRQLKKIITSGARGDGLLNVNKKDFFNLKVPLPPKEEQTIIGEILSKADYEVTLLQKKLEALQAQKKGLMQQLLTGKIRVK